MAAVSFLVAETEGPCSTGSHASCVCTRVHRWCCAAEEEGRGCFPGDGAAEAARGEGPGSAGVGSTASRAAGQVGPHLHMPASHLGVEQAHAQHGRTLGVSHLHPQQPFWGAPILLHPGSMGLTISVSSRVSWMLDPTGIAGGGKTSARGKMLRGQKTQVPTRRGEGRGGFAHAVAQCLRHGCSPEAEMRPGGPAAHWLGQGSWSRARQKLL